MSKYARTIMPIPGERDGDAFGNEWACHFEITYCPADESLDGQGCHNVWHTDGKGTGDLAYSTNTYADAHSWARDNGGDWANEVMIIPATRSTFTTSKGNACDH